MGFSPGAMQEAGTGHPGQVDYRLARQAVLDELRRGRLAQHEVCDAHPELRRAAREVGRPTHQGCPVCEEDVLVHVSYVFGPRLPAHGRCVTSQAEIMKLTKRRGSFACYVVEVCRECHWNHLAWSYPLSDP